MGVILASGSPRRRELMEMLGFRELKILPAKGEERPPAGAGPEETVLALAAAKAEEVSRLCGPGELIVAADTVVWIDGQILGKPRDEAGAASMLRRLSGRSHEVYTGVCVRRGDRVLCECEVSTVRFRPLTEEEIAAYIRSGEPMDKAGAYGAQGLGALFVSSIEGDFFNVMGLPLCRLGQMLKKQGVLLL